jgi:amino acid transporter
MLTVAYIASLSGTPALAEYGMSSMFFYALAIVLLLVPTSLVAAELATGWPQTGGVYAWAREAFGDRVGFMTVWLQWSSVVISMPAIMSVVTVNASYIFDPDLGNNRWFIFGVIVIVMWAMTAVAARGVRESAWITNAAVVVGIVVPGVVLAVLGLLYVLQGRPNQMTGAGRELLPQLGDVHTLVLASTAFLVFAGVEQSAAHASDVARPGRDYPRAILLATVIVLALIIPATLAIAVVIPAKQLSLVGGLSEAFTAMFAIYDLQWMARVMAVLIVGGLVVQIQVLFVGPIRGVVEAGRRGTLPRRLCVTNRAGMPTRMLIVQAALGTLLAGLFLLLPSVNGVYWIFTALQTQLVLLMYVLMYATVVQLRRSQPATRRAFRVPGGWPGLAVATGVGALACVGVVVINLLPPAQLDEPGEAVIYAGGLVIGMVVSCAVPLLLGRRRRVAVAATA